MKPTMENYQQLVLQFQNIIKFGKFGITVLLTGQYSAIIAKSQMLPFIECFWVCFVVSILYYLLGRISYKLLNEGIFGTDEKQKVGKK